MVECGWRFAGLHFVEVITREPEGMIRKVEFVLEEGTPGYVVRITEP
jgi:hypothetical protein